MIVELTKNNFEQEVLQYEGIVLVDFWATWCGPCRRFGEVLHALEGENLPNFKIGKINVDLEEELAQTFRVMSIPTVLIYKNGKIVDNFLGGKSLLDTKKLIESYL